MGKQAAVDVWREAVQAAAEAGKEEIRAMMQFCKSSNNRAGISNMLAMARSEPGIPVLPGKLDSDAWLFNVENGTIDLRTTEIRPHDPADYITKLAPVTFVPSTDCPKWLHFISTIMGGRDDLAAYIRRLVGYCLSGTTRDHILPFLHGSGANGKSTFVNVILQLMGSDYAIKANSDLLLVKRNTYPTEKADLHGKRCVFCVEAEDGRRTAESAVKELTGGDRVRARRMTEDFWEFTATHKVWLAGNHKPVVRGTDHGIWRRIKLVPFDVTIPDHQQDKELSDKLQTELPGILNWALLGCVEWIDQGLAEPETVMLATSGYRHEMDVIGEFIDERCELGGEHELATASLYAAYVEWCEANGEKPLDNRAFGRRLTERGITTRKAGKGKRMRCGISLRVALVA